jgi:hypothetical protein
MSHHTEPESSRPSVKVGFIWAVLGAAVVMAIILAVEVVNLYSEREEMRETRKGAIQRLMWTKRQHR